VEIDKNEENLLLIVNNNVSFDNYSGICVQIVNKHLQFFTKFGDSS